MKLKDIQDAVHKKFPLNISARKASRAREKAIEPIIGLDSCHLMTKSGGQLITPVARDPNEEYLPLAYAVVEAETKDSWTWIYCRHLYNNLRKNHPGVLIREFFWKAAKATYKAKFDRLMDELKGIDEDAHICVCLQLESIRLYLMTRFQENRQKIMKVESEICLKVLKRLHREKTASSRWLACWAGDTQFEVKNGLQSFTLDLAKGHCSWRKWDTTSKPCAHAVSCIFFNRQDVEQYVHRCFHVSTYKACYEPVFAPINRQNM
ncbi:uncharacterized protein LOC142631617 [Castanea sativa]|uniref:uncharacterized protein LOC142631617 n=1 Tax=Castanea sativa TaxID=21020 RepID=UPI003F654020